ncbi:MAG: copper amine oxidase N-terminal domain-containing protein [Clostridiales bacterium]|nr:copper amine oxidase N-terminal domain-containing protein [Clostridiales bacterium]MCF8022688.1 copper amine oxidase N-terminal domain-containing protein [Clostridiales bacterium]
MRKIILFSLMLILCFSMPAFSQENLTVEVNGNEVNFPDQEPFIDPDHNRTYVPLRFVSEALGGDVDWEQQSKTAIVDRNGKHIEMAIDCTSPTVDGNNKVLDAPARLMNARTVVPLRFVSEALGAKVKWVSDTRTVVITDGQQEPQEPEGDTYNVRGYNVPQETKLNIVPGSSDEDPYRYEINIVIQMHEGNIEQQYEDASSILSSKFNENDVNVLMDYVKQKKSRSDDLDKWFKLNGHKIRIYSSKTVPAIRINIWPQGVTW